MSYFERNSGRQATSEGAASLLDELDGEENALYQRVFNARFRPRDLRPIVQEIMAAENWLLDRLLPGQKLVILLSETHTKTFHVALQQAVIGAHINALQKDATRNFAYGYELPHDYLSGEKLIRSFLSIYHGTQAEKQTKRLFRFCLKNGVSIQFNDLSDVDGLTLNQRDQFTRDLVEKYEPDYLGKRICRVSKYEDFSLGLKLSNLAMVERATAHMEDSDAQIYLQNCGRGHALGDEQEQHFYEDSLASAFREAGFEVLTVFPSEGQLIDDIPEEAFEYEHIIRIKNTDSTEDDSQEKWDNIDAQSGGILKDPSKIRSSDTAPSMKL